jgi:hypothetical protein
MSLLFSAFALLFAIGSLISVHFLTLAIRSLGQRLDIFSEELALKRK